MKRGDKLPTGRVQSIDVWILELAKWERTEEDTAATVGVAPVLFRMAPALAVLDRTQCEVELRVGVTMGEVQGGLRLPPDVVAAAAAGRMHVEISLLVMLGDPTPEELFLRTVGRARSRMKQ